MRERRRIAVLEQAQRVPDPPAAPSEAVLCLLRACPPSIAMPMWQDFYFLFLGRLRKNCIQSPVKQRVNPSLLHSVTSFLMLPDFKTRLTVFLTQTINYYHAFLSVRPQLLLQHPQMTLIYCNHYVTMVNSDPLPSLQPYPSLSNWCHNSHNFPPLTYQPLSFST